jgi:hypothetical protein
VISDVPDLHSSFFPHLPLDGIFKGLTWLDKASKRGVEFAGEFFLLQATLRKIACIEDQHTHISPEKDFLS